MKKLLSYLALSTLTTAFVMPAIVGLAFSMYAFTPVAYAADQYSWAAQYTLNPNTPTATQVLLNGGPFPTQSACYSDQGNANSKYPGKTLDLGKQSCNCDTPIAKQGGACPGYVAPAAPSTPTTPSAPATPAPATPSTPTNTGSGSTFVPLTQANPVPGLTDGTINTSDLSSFFNALYKICIGAAAILAVLEITLGGFKVMNGDSITAHSEGRDQIMGAVLGLVLVLSPFVVFSVINPQILTLKINTSALQPGSTAPATQGNGNVDTGSGTANGNANSGGTPSTPSATAPSSPTGLTVSTQTATTATLTWTAPSGTTKPSGYDVYNGSTQVQSVTGTTATITGLTPGQKNNFTVIARAADGSTSPPSTGIEVVTVATASPGTEGSEGAWVASEWEYIPDNGYNAPPVNCWKLASPLYPVPYQGHDKTSVGTVCNAEFSGDVNTANARVYGCVFLSPGQSFTAPAAPGNACSQPHCGAYTPPGTAQACN